MSSSESPDHTESSDNTEHSDSSDHRSASSPSEFDPDIQHRPPSVVRVGPKALSAIRETPFTNESTAMGYECLRACMQSYNSGFGFRAAANITQAIGITAFGHRALESNQHHLLHPHHSTAFGYRTAADTLGVHNTIVGSSSFMFNIEGTHNSIHGSHAAMNAIEAHRNVFGGSHCAHLLKTGHDNTCIGYKSQSSGSSILGVAALGSQSLEHNEMSENTALGAFSMQQNRFGSQNSAGGYRSLRNNVDGSSNSGFGYSVMENLEGEHNAGFGARALQGDDKKSFVGSYNSAFGSHAIGECISGSHNTGTGSFSLARLERGLENTSYGSESLAQLIEGEGNVAVGSKSGHDCKKGNSNTAVGNHSGPQGEIDGSLSLGAGAKATESGEFVLGSVQWPLKTKRTADGKHILLLRLNGQTVGIPLIDQVDNGEQTDDVSSA